MRTNFENWIEKYPNYWVDQNSGWVVKDYFAKDNPNDCWVILDNRGIMISCEWKDTKEDCMDEVEFILKQEAKYGYFIFDE